MISVLLADVFVLALGAGVVSDNITSARVFSLNGTLCNPHYVPPCAHAEEINPVPGMRYWQGRAAWGTLELSGAAWLKRKSDKWSKPWRWAVKGGLGGLTAGHLYCSVRNERNRQRIFKGWRTP